MYGDSKPFLFSLVLHIDPVRIVLFFTWQLWQILLHTSGLKANTYALFSKYIFCTAIKRSFRSCLIFYSVILTFISPIDLCGVRRNKVDPAGDGMKRDDIFRRIQQ
ncbi:unnamed protein product [Rotaria magnacalcarata]